MSNGSERDDWREHVDRIDRRHEASMANIQQQFADQGLVMKGMANSIEFMRNDVQKLSSGLGELLKLREDYYREKGEEDAVERVKAKQKELDLEARERVEAGRAKVKYIAFIGGCIATVLGWLYWLYLHGKINP